MFYALTRFLFDSELALLIASDDGVGELRVDADVAAGGGDGDHPLSDGAVLPDRRVVAGALELGGVVVHVQHHHV